MSRYVYANDTHFEMAEGDSFEQFCKSVVLHKPDGLLLCGDIALAGSVDKWLLKLYDKVKVPLYFVLGNHDYYYGRIDVVREKMARLSEQYSDIEYLSNSELIMISSHTVLIGHDGWGDARCGDYDSSSVRMNDFVCIEELCTMSKEKRKRTLNALGDEAATFIRGQLLKAVELGSSICMVTHVPPFLEASMYEGKPSDDDYAPYFVCKAVGDVILEVMSQYPEKNLTVLCGHTHGQGEFSPLANVKVIASAAEYRTPRISGYFDC